MAGYPQDAIARLARIEAALTRIYDRGLYNSATQRDIEAARAEIDALRARVDVNQLPAL